jgi:DNA-binding NarL/FixJ family response regulator
MHLSSSARHLEEIRRVTSRLSELVTESERARLELQMLFGVHVYARAKVVPDLAVSRGEEAYRAAKLAGDRSIEFLAAGGVALTLLELGDVAGAEKWLALAATTASMAPSRTRAILLESWRGMARAGAQDAAGALRHLEQAVTLATDSGRASARCEALARMALVAASLLGPREGGRAADAEESMPDAALIEVVERSTAQVRELLALLPGHAPWGAQADAALATVALHRGDVDAAAAAGGAAFEALQTGLHEDTSLDIVLPAARAVLVGGSPDVQAFIREYLQGMLARIAQGTADEAIRVRWLTGPVGRRLVDLADVAGEAERPVVVGEAAASGASSGLVHEERRLLQLLTEGQTNAEIAAQLGVDEAEVGRRLARLQAQLGASSRAEATSLAFRGLAAVGSR